MATAATYTPSQKGRPKSAEAAPLAGRFATGYTKTGTKATKAAALPKEIFGLEVKNTNLLAEAYRAYLANGRQADAVTLTRGEVRGGGKKPWRQKGTGRARAGSRRSPIWAGGGITFGPTGEQNFTLKMPVKAKRMAIRQALSAKAAADAIKVIETFDCPDGKVKQTVQLLKKLDAKGRVLLVVSKKDELVERATRNVQRLKAIQATYLNVFDVVNADTIVISEKSLSVIKQWLNNEAKPETKVAPKPAEKPSE